jgi:hypothetical protein
MLTTLANVRFWGDSRHHDLMPARDWQLPAPFPFSAEKV